MSFKRFEDFLNRPGYFVLCCAFGLFLWSFCFIKESEPKQVGRFPTVSVEVRDRAKAELVQIQKRTPAGVNKKIPKRFERNPAFQLFEKVTEKK